MKEVKKLLAEDIIGPSVLISRVQVVMTKSENHRRRVAIDYELFSGCESIHVTGCLPSA